MKSKSGLHLFRQVFRRPEQVEPKLPGTFPSWWGLFKENSIKKAE
jgi:hypothetical protein